MGDQRPDLGVLTRLELYFSVRQFTRAMRRFAEILEYDYDMVMIFFIVAESSFQSIIHLGGAGADAESIEKAYLESITLGLSILNIGEASGIPRETVRRKVKRLIDLNYLATLDRNKNIYVPISTFVDPRFLNLFRDYVSDTAQFVRTVQFYSKGEA